MGYETKLIVGHRFECNIGNYKDIFMIPMATFDLKKMCSDKFTNRNSALFKTPIDFRIYEYRLQKEISYSSETDIGVAQIAYHVTTDCYGDLCHYALVPEVCEQLKNYIENSENDEYSKYTLIPCLKYLEAIKDDKDVIVIHYGH